MRVVHALGLSALLAAPAQAADIAARYDCGGAAAEATFHNPDGGGPGSVTLILAGERLHLPQAVSADGGRYAAGTDEFWIKGSDATLTRGGTATACRGVD